VTKLYFLLSAIIALALSGCVTSSIVVGNTRPSIKPEEVKIYISKPAIYEDIALISSNNTGGSPFGEQAKVNTVINRMKNEAAKLGANGLIIQQIGDQNFGAVGNGILTPNALGNIATGGVMVTTTNLQLKTGSAIAIYVPPEKNR